MQKIKKTLKIAGILILCSVIFNIISIYADLFYYKFNLFYFIVDILALIITIGTGIFYLLMLKKDQDYFLEHYNWFNVVSLLNIINIFIIWIFVFWVQIVVVRQLKLAMFQAKSSRQNSTYINGDEVILGTDDYIVRDQMDNLTNELNELAEKRNKNLISEEEYELLKQQCINKYMNAKNK
ncbi:MAG: hypothetical protein E7376_02005 [Clostridiales bacterium]|nr:hypothetical protein [Clostridiales bacterium]